MSVIQCAPALMGYITFSECSADKYAELFVGGSCNVHHFVWQVDIADVAH